LLNYSKVLLEFSYCLTNFKYSEIFYLNFNIFNYKILPDIYFFHFNRSNNLSKTDTIFLVFLIIRTVYTIPNVKIHTINKKTVLFFTFRTFYCHFYLTEIRRTLYSVMVMTNTTHRQENHLNRKNTNGNYVPQDEKLCYNMTNDYMFRAVLQKNKKVLKGLIGSLLHLDPESLDVKVTNPIILGQSFENKDFILDINVIINEAARLNLEMQIANYSKRQKCMSFTIIDAHDRIRKLVALRHAVGASKRKYYLRLLYNNWKERSLSYLCRSFDSVYKGDDYINAVPVIQISFLDFDLFPEKTEFYATYMLKNVKNGTIYTDKLQLSVIELNHTELATDEDRLHDIDKWVAFFKTRTWKELKDMAATNQYMEAAADTIFELRNCKKITFK